MTEKTTVKPPVWFWIVSVVALIWNLLGSLAYLAEAFMKETVRTGMSEEQIAIMENAPSWETALFAIAVWFGVLGCIFLLIRKKWAIPVLTISVLAVLLRTVYYFFMTNATEVFDVVQGTVMPILTVAIGIALVYFARVANARGWIS